MVDGPSVIRVWVRSGQGLAHTYDWPLTRARGGPISTSGRSFVPSMSVFPLYLVSGSSWPWPGW